MAAPLATALGDYGNETTASDITSPGSAYGMVLDGSLVVATCDINFTPNDAEFAIQDAETDRDGVVPTATPTYYIKHKVNLNQNISYHVGTVSTDGEPEATAGNDDSWSTTAISLAAKDKDDWDSVYLPSGSNDFNDVAEIVTCDQCDRSQTHQISMKISATDQGVLSAALSIHHVAWTGYLTEDIATAQEAYWTGAAPTPGENDADILAAPLLSTDLDTLYSAQKSAAEAEVNGKNYIKSYTLTLDSVAASTTSALSKLAAMRNKNDASVFEAGDQVVLKTGAAVDYQVTVDSNAKTIAKGDVFGIFVHDATAAN